jgi:hypothetical protein
MEVGTLLFLGAGIFSLIFLLILFVAFYNIYTKSYKPNSTIPMLAFLGLLFLLNGLFILITLLNIASEF